MAGLGARTWVAGEVVTAANVQGYLQDQAVMVFASAAARDSALASPSEGMTCYLKDVDQLQTYNGSAWNPPINLPWGVVAKATATSNFLYDTAEKVSITASTFTAVANRLYKVTYYEPELSPPNGTNTVYMRIRLTNATGTIYAAGRVKAESNNELIVPGHIVAYTTLTAGSTVLVGTLVTPNAGGSKTLTRASGNAAFIIVEDIGPS
jgi:hypothetical protein